MPGVVENIGGCQAREGEEGMKGRGWRGRNSFGWSIVLDRVTIAVVSTLSIVLLWRECSTSMVQRETRPVPT